MTGNVYNLPRNDFVICQINYVGTFFVQAENLKWNKQRNL